MTLNERQRAVAALEKEFGSDWLTVAQELGTENLRQRVGKELTSFLAFPERGEGGKNTWRGNCSPKVVESIVKYVLDTKRYYGKDTSDFTLLDPMSGSGTSGIVAENLGIRSCLYDLNPNPAKGRGSWNALKDEVDESADVIFWHPPYICLSIQFAWLSSGQREQGNLHRAGGSGDRQKNFPYVPARCQSSPDKSVFGRTQN